MPGERSPHVVDADLNYGIDYRYGYSQDACLMTSKREMLARELILCTFNPLSGDTLERCKANQSLDYHQSFLRGNNSAVQRFSIDRNAGLKNRYEKQCPADCIDERFLFNCFYSLLTSTEFELNTEIKLSINSCFINNRTMYLFSSNR